jgi:ubiquinone/menaquinone biosynthesis C-methylase UbiE
VIYNGEKLPFDDLAFDTTLLITVLHHTPDPDAVLQEAIRVSARRIVVMEDIYTNPFQKYLTWFTDSLVNMEFVGHPHTNRSDKQWQATFSKMGLKLVGKETFRTLVFFRQVIYVLERK